MTVQDETNSRARNFCDEREIGMQAITQKLLKKEDRIVKQSLCALFLAILAVAGCSSKTGQSSENASQTVHLTGAGSTFVYPIMTQWISQFQSAHAGMQINYQSIGSGGGIQQVKAGLVDFGASDAALDDKQLASMQPMIQIPESAGPVCITYNLPELKQPLRLTAAALSGIYLGTIKNWRDPAIAHSNPGVTLPNKTIIVVHRSEGSGTTNIFTTYLSTVNPTWAKNVGKGIAVNWPAPGTLGGKGSEGVTGIVKQSEGSIGYTELNYATNNHLPVAMIENKAGKWVTPTSTGATAAIAAFTDALAKDVRTPIVDPPASAPDAYPISGFTFLLIPKDGANKSNREALKAFVQFIITTGQDQADSLDYSKLPDSVVQLDGTLLNQMTAVGRPLQ